MGKSKFCINKAVINITAVFYSVFFNSMLIGLLNEVELVFLSGRMTLQTCQSIQQILQSDKRRNHFINPLKKRMNANLA